MRTSAIRAATAVLLGVALLGTAACSSEQLGKEYGQVGGDATDGAETEPAGAPGEDSTATEGEAGVVVTEPIEVPGKAVGTRAHPLPVGAEFTDGDWTVTLGQPHEGWEEIRAVDPYSEQPTEGTEYWMVPVTATYTGEESAAPWLDLQFAFVGEDGRSYSDQCLALVPDDLYEVDDLYTDATVEANVCLQVPANSKGLWTVTAFWGDPVFFAAEAGDDDA